MSVKGAALATEMQERGCRNDAKPFRTAAVWISPQESEDTAIADNHMAMMF